MYTNSNMYVHIATTFDVGTQYNLNFRNSYKNNIDEFKNLFLLFNCTVGTILRTFCAYNKNIKRLLECFTYIVRNFH